MYVDETRQAGGGMSREYVDVLGRVVRAAVQGFDGTWVYTDTDYDNVGRVSRQSEPYYAGARDVYRTTYEYDLLGRVVRTVLPDDTASRRSEITVRYAGRTVTTTNALGQVRTETRNALGEVISTADHAGTSVSHEYDAWGRVVRTTTSGAGVNDVVVETDYDERGRRKALPGPGPGQVDVRVQRL